MSEAKRLAMDDYTSTPSELATEATDACAAKKSVTTVFAHLASEQGLPSTTFDRAVTTTRENLIIEVAKTFTRIREQFPELYRVAAESAKLGKSREERRRYGNFGIALVKWRACLSSAAVKLARKSPESASVMADAAFANCKTDEHPATSVYSYIWRAAQNGDDRAREAKLEMIETTRQQIIKDVIDMRLKH